MRDNGLYVAWQRHDLNVSYLSFRHTTDAALRLSGSYNTDFSHCTLTECQQAIRSTETIRRSATSTSQGPAARR
ncbi:MAG: hypothetical protein R2810_11770 [Flavobacteriales bacterium]